MKINIIFSVCIKIFIFVIPIFFGISNYLIEQFVIIKSNFSIICYILLAMLFVSLTIEAYNQYKIIKYKKNHLLVKAYRSFISGYFDDQLRNISDDLKYSEEERLTLFLYSSSQNKFYSVGRYSKSAKFNKLGRYVIDDEREYVYNVINEQEEKHNAKSPSIDSKKFNMQSKSMYGVPIEYKGIKIAVVIAQSMNNNFWKSKDKRQKLKEKVCLLQEQIVAMNINPNILPSEIDLSEKGL
ncbi:hypothetical protein L7A57_001246 [Campylobacter coli]|nr:hypothetical protein [Campylobacter coli]